MNDGQAATLADVDRFSWFHGIDFGAVASRGRVTPPNWSLYGSFRLMESLDLTGSRVLDVGTMDGLVSFIAESEGAAEVHATDLYDRPSFEFAKTALGSEVVYHPRTSIEELLERFGRHSFDVVVMCGLMYHLVSPLRSLLVARSLLRTDGVLLLETVTRPGEDPVMTFNPADPVVDEYTTYFVPTESCVTEMMRFCLLNPAGVTEVPTGGRYSRTSYLARAVTLADATPSTDLMGQAQVRAASSVDDKLVDEFSFARLATEPRATVGVAEVPGREVIDRQRFVTRFALQPAE